MSTLLELDVSKQIQMKTCMIEMINDNNDNNVATTTTKNSDTTENNDKTTENENTTNILNCTRAHEVVMGCVDAVGARGAFDFVPGCEGGEGGQPQVVGEPKPRRVWHGFYLAATSTSTWLRVWAYWGAFACTLVLLGLV